MFSTSSIPDSAYILRCLVHLTISVLLYSRTRNSMKFRNSGTTIRASDFKLNLQKRHMRSSAGFGTKNSFKSFS